MSSKGHQSHVRKDDRITSETREVIIIGGGLVGLSIAYHLVERGVRDIVLLEREPMWAWGSSARSAGGVRLEFSHPSSVRFSQYGLEMFHSFEDLFGISASFNPCGYLFVTRDPQRWNIMVELAAMQRTLGVPVETLTPDDVRVRYRYIHMPDIVGATFCGLDGVADPGAVAYGWMRRAQTLGVEIRLNAQVTQITQSGGRATGVVTQDGTVIHAPVVVNAAGPQARSVGALAGVALPVDPYRRSVYVTDTFSGLPPEIPMTLEFENTSYIRREGRSILMGMSDPLEPSSESVETDQESLEKLVGTVLSWVPALEKASIMRGWAGLYEVSPDGTAIIGEAASLPGFFYAVGFSGHGFMHSPAAGRVVAELITGEAPFVDLTPYARERFQHQTTHETFVI
ncbi:MAG: NAD(P)/FAD-dependent oxidoreductase [Sulfobacillus sp.]